MDAIGPHRKFMGGDSPNLADLAVYGAITSFEGC
uniref:Glutathione S-transferase n=1 Tax=Romanomermis culicivorax TaxID=13658 RepID=A0A915JJ14_ROMCU